MTIERAAQGSPVNYDLRFEMAVNKDLNRRIPQSPDERKWLRGLGSRKPKTTKTNSGTKVA